MNKKLTTSLPPIGSGVVDRHLEMAQPTKTCLAKNITDQRWRQRDQDRGAVQAQLQRRREARIHRRGSPDQHQRRRCV